jgi:diguanylate cyclase
LARSTIPHCRELLYFLESRKMTIWSPVSAFVARIREFIATLLCREDVPASGKSQTASKQPQTEPRQDRKGDLAASLFAKIHDGLSDHSDRLATFSRDIDPANGSASPRGPMEQMQRANHSLEALVEESVERLARSCGTQFSAERSQLEAYQKKTTAFDQKLSAVPDDLLMSKVVAELLSVVRELRDENESARKEVASAQKEIRELATRASAAERDARIDTLTQLMNRRAFDEVHAACHAVSGEHGYCLLLLDADHFKNINDRHGHPAGDAVLALIGKIIRENCRIADHYARWGGEEFAVLMPDADDDIAWGVAERLRRKIESTVLRIGALEQNKIKFTVSCGIAKSAPGKTRSRILEEVDQALYAAKAQGRNRTIVYRDCGNLSPANGEAVAVKACAG